MVWNTESSPFLNKIKNWSQMKIICRLVKIMLLWMLKTTEEISYLGWKSVLLRLVRWQNTAVLIKKTIRNWPSVFKRSDWVTTRLLRSFLILTQRQYSVRHPWEAQSHCYDIPAVPPEIEETLLRWGYPFLCRARWPLCIFVPSTQCGSTSASLWLPGFLTLLEAF